MLIAIKEYLIKHRFANLQEISKQFHQSPENMRCMLNHWIRKGKVQCLGKPDGCGTKCHSCNPQHAEVYFWHDKSHFNKTLT